MESKLPPEAGMIRAELRWFVDQMEQVLRKNDWKGGWKDMSREEVLERLEEELDELKTAVCRSKPTDEIIAEAVDIANFAMFLAYNERGKGGNGL